MECEKFGSVEDVQILHHPRTGAHTGVGTARFSDAARARSALHGLQHSIRYGKKINASWDADGKGAEREKELLVRESSQARASVPTDEQKPKSWSAPVPHLEDMEMDLQSTSDWSTPGAWMNRFAPKPPPSPPSPSPSKGGDSPYNPVAALQETPTYTSSTKPKPEKIFKIDKTEKIKKEKTEDADGTSKRDSAKPDSPYDPNAAFDAPPSPTAAAQTTTTQQPQTVQKQEQTTVDLGDDLTDEQMEITKTPPRPTQSDYDPHHPTEPQSPITAEWYYMQSQTHAMPRPGAQMIPPAPYPPYPHMPHPHAMPPMPPMHMGPYPPYPHMPHMAPYPPLPPHMTYSYPAPPVVTMPIRRMPLAHAYALQITHLPVQAETLAVPLREHFKAFGPTDVFHDHATWYVEFRDPSSLERAVRVLNGSILQGWKISVSVYSRATPKHMDDDHRKRRLDSNKGTYFNKPQEARAVAIVMADLLRTALRDAQRSIIDTAIKELIASRTARPVPKNLEGPNIPAREGVPIDFKSLPSFKKIESQTSALEEEALQPQQPKKKRRVIPRVESEEEDSKSSDDEESTQYSIPSSESESDQEDEEERSLRVKKGKKRKDRDDIISKGSHFLYVKS